MDLAALLRAQPASRPQKFSIYLVDRDRDNQPIDIEPWIKRARYVMTLINGGCTQMPAASGVWVNLDNGEMIEESTTIIYSYLGDPERFAADFEQIVLFLHDYGAATRQDAVMSEFSGWSDDDGCFISESYIIPRANYLMAGE